MGGENWLLPPHVPCGYTHLHIHPHMRNTSNNKLGVLRWTCVYCGLEFVWADNDPWLCPGPKLVSSPWKGLAGKVSEGWPCHRDKKTTGELLVSSLLDSFWLGLVCLCNNPRCQGHLCPLLAFQHQCEDGFCAPITCPHFSCCSEVVTAAIRSCLPSVKPRRMFGLYFLELLDTP